MTTRRTLRRPLGIALATFVAGAALSLVGSAVSQPAQAREFEPLVVRQDKPTFVTFEGLPESLSYRRKPDPDFCRDKRFCDTIPVKIPTPKLARGAGYKLVFKARDVNGADGANIEVYLWDNKQLKEKYGKCQPGEQCYDPLETDYTDILAITDPETGGPNSDGVYTVGEPDLIDYNITVLNYSGFNEGYRIYMEIQVEGFTPPKEVKPPSSAVYTETRSSTSGSTGGKKPTTNSPPVNRPDIGDASDLPGLNDLLIERDPELQAIRDQNLADQLKAPPTQISTVAREQSGPPPPVSGLTLLLWLAVMPAALAGGATTLVQRRRVRLPDLS